MIKKQYILLALMPAFIIGCASARKTDEAIQKLSNQIDGLRVSIDESRSRLDQLDAKFTILDQKVEASKSSIEKMTVVPDAPPAGLSVVKLSGDEPAAANVQAPAVPKKEKPRVAPEPAKARVQAKASPRVERDETARVQALREAPRAGSTAKTKLNQKAQTPEEMYSRAQGYYSAGDYGPARALFLELAREYPNDALADNALYWAGETYYNEKDFHNALLRFKEVAQKYPSQNKAPDALLKAGYSSIEVKDNAGARGYLAELVKKYPGSEAAEKARRVLISLSAE